MEPDLTICITTKRPRPMRKIPLLVATAILVLAVALLADVVQLPVWLPLPSWLIWIAAVLSGAVAINELLGKPVPFLRWSALRMMFGMKTLLRDWQVGDGREQRVGDHVVAKARPGDVDHAVQVIDEFAYKDSILINVGDVKGVILDTAIDRVRPTSVLELGTYVGYSALRIARRLPNGGRVFSIEFNESNAAIARRIIAHAGMSDHIEVVVGTLGDGGRTLDHLETQCGLTTGKLDFVFIDHAKDEYLPDLQRILDRGWLRSGAVVVADNIKLPGAPEYLAYMREQEGKLWRSREHSTHVEYQSVLRDMVLESDFLGR